MYCLDQNRKERVEEKPTKFTNEESKNRLFNNEWFETMIDLKASTDHSTSLNLTKKGHLKRCYSCEDKGSCIEPAATT